MEYVGSVFCSPVQAGHQSSHSTEVPKSSHLSRQFRETLNIPGLADTDQNMQLYALEERWLSLLGFCDKNFPFILSSLCDRLSHDLICVLNTQTMVTTSLSKCTIFKKERQFSSCVNYTLAQQPRINILSSSLRTPQQSYGEKNLSEFQIKFKFLTHPLLSSLNPIYSGASLQAVSSKMSKCHGLQSLLKSQLFRRKSTETEELLIRKKILFFFFFFF